MAGFGAWGMFKPQAPKEWDAVGKNVIIGRESTTRYVVLKTGKKVQLHPVLNLTSAKLLINGNQGTKPISVDEKFLDDGKLQHGATIGIPYAPDRLPDAAEAEKAKTWVVCERPRGNGTAGQKAAFVFDERDEKKVQDKDKLRGGEMMYVRGQNANELYAVDKSGTKYRLRNNPGLLAQVVNSEQPQRVSEDWLDTLNEGSGVDFPTVPGMGSQAGSDQLGAAFNKVGVVLKAPTAGGPQQYVVLKDRIAPVSDFVARLLLNSPDSAPLLQNGKPHEVSGSEVEDAGEPFLTEKNWPDSTSGSVNNPSATAGSRNTLCNVLKDVGKGNKTKLGTWVGDSFPAQLPTGSCQRLRQPGLRPALPAGERHVEDRIPLPGHRHRPPLRPAANWDSAGDDAGIGSDKKSKEDAPSESDSAEARLGFENVRASRIPAAWSQVPADGAEVVDSCRQPAAGFLIRGREI